VKQCKPTKTWERTRLQNLVRHKSGRYYARAFAGGKEVWKSLKTSHFSVAEARLAEFLKEHRGRRSSSGVSAKMTFDAAAAIHLSNLDDNLRIKRIKPRTRDYWRQRLEALIKSWPTLNETEIRKITQADCKKWASSYAGSPTNCNNTVAILRHVLNVAVQAGVVYGNSAAILKRTPVRAKQITLPGIDGFNALIAEMRAGHGRNSMNCADFAEGLAYTGCRLSEAREITWQDVDFNAGMRAVDIRDPFNPREVGFYIPAVTARTDKRCVTVAGASRCQVAIQTNNVEVDDRGYIYLADRADTGLHIVELTGAARAIANLP
jgi:integrase